MTQTISGPKTQGERHVLTHAGQVGCLKRLNAVMALPPPFLWPLPRGLAGRRCPDLPSTPAFPMWSLNRSGLPSAYLNLLRPKTFLGHASLISPSYLGDEKLHSDVSEAAATFSSCGRLRTKPDKPIKHV